MNNLAVECIKKYSTVKLIDVEHISVQIACISSPAKQREDSSSYTIIP